jgi:hypothetical protein
MLQKGIIHQNSATKQCGGGNSVMKSLGFPFHLPVAGLSVLLSILAAAWSNIFNLNSWALLFSCPFHALTGLHCPGCGATRALLELTQGHWAAAFHLNPLAICMMPPAAGLIFWRRRHGIPSGLWCGILVLAIAFGILRNIRAYPFVLLSPG